MTADNLSLDDLRREIDEIDMAVHDLLMRRVSLADRIGHRWILGVGSALCGLANLGYLLVLRDEPAVFSRFVPLSLASWYGRLAARSKRYAFLFLLMVFLVIPAIGILITELLRSLSPS